MSFKARERFVGVVLLMVFVPMLLVVSLHRHEGCCCHAASCECTGEVEIESSVDDCPLCQFYHLPFLPSTRVYSVKIAPVKTTLFVARCLGACKTQNYDIPARGPPSLLS